VTGDGRFPEARRRLRRLLKRLNIFDPSRPEQLDEGGRVSSGRYDGDGGGSRPE
jgi:hypothetical protein